MDFIIDYKHTKENYSPAFWFIFYNDEILLEETQGSFKVPFFKDIPELGLQRELVEYIGSMDGRDCYAARINKRESLPGYFYQRLLPAYNNMDESLFWIAGRAFHLLGWRQKTGFCSVCGGRMEAVAEERARQCVSCGTRVYPRISPAVIVAITKGDKILLARANRFANAMHSVIAGFVEPGETLEDCVRREIREEVGIEVKNIQYFSSQPWPFPDSLMVAFTAEYSSGTLVIDNNEIAEAGWYGAHELPQIPMKASIARKLIDSFTDKYRQV